MAKKKNPKKGKGEIDDICEIATSVLKLWRKEKPKIDPRRSVPTSRRRYTSDRLRVAA
jgi:hypothetical protein